MSLKKRLEEYEKTIKSCKSKEEKEYLRTDMAFELIDKIEDIVNHILSTKYSNQ